MRYEGTFFNDKLEGTCVITVDNNLKLVAEFKEGKYFGKSTLYIRSVVWNYLGQTGPSHEAGQNPFYEEDGTP